MLKLTEENLPDVAYSIGVSVIDLRMVYFGARIRRSKTVTFMGQTFEVDIRD